jgi:hypothetical protein
VLSELICGAQASSGGRLDRFERHLVGDPQLHRRSEPARSDIVAGITKVVVARCTRPRDRSNSATAYEENRQVHEKAAVARLTLTVESNSVRAPT